MKILTFTSLYPNASRPQHAVFVENRLRRLVADGRIEARVVAPVPWFPLRAKIFGRYALNATVPRHERRHGIPILHPRYPTIPKAGMTLAPLLMYAWSKSALAGLVNTGYDFDLIDAHYFYPDGVAAALLGRALGKPVTITARGTDINVIPRYAAPRHMIRWAAGQAAGLIAVSRALKESMTALGVEPQRIRVLRNGVDLEAFRPCERGALRDKFALPAPVLASVGNLLPNKGHDLVIRALAELPGVSLVIVGTGPEERRLRALAGALGLARRVRFLGSIPHDAMFEIYGVADVLVLASAREGWPNVLLEAMACGTLVAATRVSGIPEIVAAPAAGRLIAARSPAAIAASVRALLDDPPARAETRAYAERFSWDETARGQAALFDEILGARQGPGAGQRP